MSEYLALREQIAQLEKQAEVLRIAERHAAISTCRTLIQTFSILPLELGYAGKRAVTPAQSAAKRAHSSAGTKLPAKYRDSYGNSWTGRGIQPLWLKTAIEQGASLEALRVSPVGPFGA